MKRQLEAGISVIIQLLSFILAWQLVVDHFQIAIRMQNILLITQPANRELLQNVEGSFCDVSASSDVLWHVE